MRDPVHDLNLREVKRAGAIDTGYDDGYVTQESGTTNKNGGLSRPPFPSDQHAGLA
jgi:hypothetical protein